MEWRDCVVIYIDLIDLKKRLRNPTAGSLLMRSFHELVVDEMERGLASLNHAYVWNDSTLLLAFVDNSSVAYQACLQDAETLKRRVDSIGKSYAIAVKGKAFPRLRDSKRNGGTIKKRRTTILKTSSYAMANCFVIEDAVRNLRSVWYLDERIARHLKEVKPNGSIRLKLLPEYKHRNVFYYDRYLWS
jgi:hypothetical protein